MTRRALAPMAIVAAGVTLTLGLALAAARQVPAAAPAPASADGGVPSDKVKILIQTNPAEKGVVMWGKKPLGPLNPKGPKKPKPLVVERPRDSGPMDLVVRTKGFLPVHTRAYTFTDAKVYVKLTPLEEKKTLFGYREEIPDAGAPEAGAPAFTGPPMPGLGPDGGAR